MKGGVAKTTLAVNIAACLAKLKEKKVLLIDLDPQYNATQYLVNLKINREFVDGSKPTVFDIMAPRGVSIPSIANGIPITPSPRTVSLDDVKRTLFEKDGSKLDLIPGTIYLIGVEISREMAIENKLKNFIERIKDAYDFIIIDCPPTFSVFLSSGYLASDYYLVPLKPDPLSTLGIPLLERVFEFYQEAFGRKEIKCVGIVFTMVRKTNEMDNVMAGIRQVSEGKRYVFSNYLSMSTKVASAARKNLLLFESRDTARYGNEIKDITDEFLKRF
jgi:chromosome partitioning protein